MSKGGGNSGPSAAFYDSMLDMSKRNQQLGDLYSSINLGGYRPGDKAHALKDAYYPKPTSETDTTSNTETKPGDRVVKNGYGNFTITSDGKVIDQQGDDVTETGMGQSILNNNRIYTPHDGKSVTSKVGFGAGGITGGDDPVVGRSVTSKSELGAGGITGGYDPTAGLQQQINNGPLSTPEGQAAVTAASEKIEKDLGLGAGFFKNAAKYGNTTTDADGNNIYTSQSGQKYDASAQGATQLGTELSMSLMEPTRDLGYETIQSQRKILPSSTDASISTNELTTANNKGAMSLLPKRLDITNQYLDETKKGINVGQQMNEASTDVAAAFKKTNAARDRSMARMGVAPGSGAYQDTSTDNARAEVAARGAARNTAQNENYRRLGAVALGS